MLAHWYQLLFQLNTTPPEPQPENGPSGGASWLKGYKPKYGYNKPEKRRNKRDEILFLEGSHG